MFLLPLSFLLFSYLSQSYATVSDCSKAISLFKLTSMSFLPDPPVKGQNSTLFLSMNVPSAVTGGTATYSATYNFIPLTPTTDNLCTVAPAGCPIQPGTLNTVSSIPFDGSLVGSLTFKIEWKDLAAEQLMCVLIKTNI
jgi:hypothetical protein